MRRMCELFRRVKDGTKTMVAAMRKYFKEHAEEIIQQSADDNAAQLTWPSAATSEVGAKKADDDEASTRPISALQRIQV